MKDALGQDLQIGDEVAFAQLGYRHIKTSKIRRFTPKKAELENGSQKESAFIVKLPQGIPEGHIIVRQKYLEEVERDADHLNQLKNAGVDNWGEYFSYRDPEEYCDMCGLHDDDCECPGQDANGYIIDEEGLKDED